MLASQQFIEFFYGRKFNMATIYKLNIPLLAAYAVLIEAEDKQITNPAVRKWLDDFKDTIYHAKDLINEIVVESLWCKVEPESQAILSMKMIGHNFVGPLDY